MSQSVPQKIVLKSTTKISLNDRFTNIQRSPPMQQQTVRVKMAAEQQASAKNRRLAQQMANRPAVQAALNTKNRRGGRSLQQRLGRGNIKARLTLPPGQNLRGGQMRGRGRGRGSGFGSARGQGVSRGSVRGIGFARGGRISRGAYRGRTLRGANTLRGARRGVAVGFRGGRGRGAASPGRGSFRGFRGGGFRGGRGRGRAGRARGRGRGGPAPSKSDLDNQLDEYMSKTKGHLDNELDSYMAQTGGDMQ